MPLTVYFKRTLNRRLFYVFKGEAYLYDSIGNITWGALMNRYGWPEWLAKLGAGGVQVHDDFILWKNSKLTFDQIVHKPRSIYLDEDRDTKAIGVGFQWDDF